MQIDCALFIPKQKWAKNYFPKMKKMNGTFNRRWFNWRKIVAHRLVVTLFCCSIFSFQNRSQFRSRSTNAGNIYSSSTIVCALLNGATSQTIERNCPAVEDDDDEARMKHELQNAYTHTPSDEAWTSSCSVVRVCVCADETKRRRESNQTTKCQHSFSSYYYYCNVLILRKILSTHNNIFSALLLLLSFFSTYSRTYDGWHDTARVCARVFFSFLFFFQFLFRLLSTGLVSLCV